MSILSQQKRKSHATVRSTILFQSYGFWLAYLLSLSLLFRSLEVGPATKQRNRRNRCRTLHQTPRKEYQHGTQSHPNIDVKSCKRRGGVRKVFRETKTSPHNLERVVLVPILESDFRKHRKNTIRKGIQNQCKTMSKLKTQGDFKIMLKWVRKSEIS